MRSFSSDWIIDNRRVRLYNPHYHFSKQSEPEKMEKEDDLQFPHFGLETLKAIFVVRLSRCCLSVSRHYSEKETANCLQV